VPVVPAAPTAKQILRAAERATAPIQVREPAEGSVAAAIVAAAAKARAKTRNWLPPVGSPRGKFLTPAEARRGPSPGIRSTHVDDTTLQRLRPAAQTMAAIEAAMVSVLEETGRVQTRLEELKAIRPSMLLTATTAELRANADAVADAESDLEQLAALGRELDRQHRLAADAEAAGEREAKFKEAAAAIEKSNEWFKRNYLKHARALREGLELEERALSLVQALQRKGALPHGLPAMARAFVGSEGRSFSYLTKLPGAEPGAAVSLAGETSRFLGCLLCRAAGMKVFVARGRSVVADGATFHQGELVDLPPAEAAFLTARGFVQDTPPTLYAPQADNPAGIGPRSAVTQGPEFKR
jgi:hypothetical protein